MKTTIKCLFFFVLIFSNSFAQNAETVYNKAIGSIFTIVTDANMQGSGFVFQDATTIVTNYHVIKGAKKIVVIPANQKNVEYEVTGIVAADMKLDIAVLKIKGTFRKPIEAAPELKVGRMVVAIGTPEGLEATVSQGIVSALRENYIQHTAPLSSGSSGSPLLDENGKLLGMNTLIIKQGQNLNFSIPTQTILNVLQNKHKPLSIAEATRFYETGSRVSKSENSEEPAFYLTFGEGVRHEAILMKTNEQIIALVKYPNRKNQFEVIKETCAVDTTNKDTNWIKIACNNPSSLIGNKIDYFADTFWVNKEGSVLLSDGQTDKDGKLIFLPVEKKILKPEDLKKILPAFGILI